MVVTRVELVEAEMVPGMYLGLGRNYWMDLREVLFVRLIG